ncbi:MAG: hypothetical protein IKC34_03610 [Clostridia bacterium]|nr:hypothetical protein [Clostridia bacterium]
MNTKKAPHGKPWGAVLGYRFNRVLNYLLEIAAPAAASSEAARGY